MFRGFSLRRGSSLTREGEAWRAQGAMLTPAPDCPKRKEADPNSKPRRRSSVALWLLASDVRETTASTNRM